MTIDNPIYVFAKWKVKEGQIENVLSILKKMQNESGKEKGNLFYKVHQSNSDINTLVLFEGYTDKLANTEHRSSSHFQDLIIGKIVPLLEDREITLATHLLNEISRNKLLTTKMYKINSGSSLHLNRFYI